MVRPARSPCWIVAVTRGGICLPQHEVRHYFLRGLDHVSAVGSCDCACRNASTMFPPPRIHPAAAECQARQNVGDVGRRDPWEMSSLGGRTS
jgi:hypothetical protein